MNITIENQLLVICLVKSLDDWNSSTKYQVDWLGVMVLSPPTWLKALLLLNIHLNSNVA